MRGGACYWVGDMSKVERLVNVRGRRREKKDLLSGNAAVVGGGAGWKLRIDASNPGHEREAQCAVQYKGSEK